MHFGDMLCCPTDMEEGFDADLYRKGGNTTPSQSLVSPTCVCWTPTWTYLVTLEEVEMLTIRKLLNAVCRIFVLPLTRIEPKTQRGS